jgi:hypothetical protein
MRNDKKREESRKEVCPVEEGGLPWWGWGEIGFGWEGGREGERARGGDGEREREGERERGGRW